MMLRNRILLAAAFLMLLLPIAAAQPGPVPGTNPLDYTRDYVKGQAASATNDTAGYVEDKATPENATREVTHVAFIACWTAYDKTGEMIPGCEAYFTPPGQVQPQHQAHDDNSTAAADALANATLATANEVLDAVNDTVADPVSAPSQVERIVAAVQGFANAVADIAGDIVSGAVALLRGIGEFVATVVRGLFGAVALGGIVALDGMEAGASGVVDVLAAIGQGVGSAVRATAAAVGDAVGAVGSAIAGAASAVANAVSDAADAVGDAVSSAASGIGDFFAGAADAIADGADAVGDAAASAADSVGDAVADAADAVGDAASSAVDAVKGWFSSSDDGSVDSDARDLDVSETTDDAKGLIDGVLDAVPA